MSENQSYPEAAAHAVQIAHAQHQSPFYGYVRSGVSQKIYLFPQIDDVHAWFSQHVQAQPDHDYAAAFAAADLRAPIAGMEHFNSGPIVGCGPNIGCDPQIGNWLPFLLGLPLGGAAGYFLRRWQEPASAREQVPLLRDATPFLREATRRLGLPPSSSSSGDPYVGGPWLDMVGQDSNYGGYVDGGYDAGGYDAGGYDAGGYDAGGYDAGGYDDGYGDPMVGGPWLDLVGASVDAARRRLWPQTRALIQSAIDEVKSHDASYPAEAYVWTLDAPALSPYAGSTPGSVVMLEGTTNIVPFSSQGEALKYLREVAQTRPVALAMFERSSSHWPNPTAWRKSDDPDHASLIAQHVASRTSTRTSGTVVGSAVDDVRRRARSLADKRAGTVLGVIHTSKDGLWHTMAFRTPDDADDWLNTATQDPASFTYAAYFDKEGESWPSPYLEKIGGFRTPKTMQQYRRTGIVGAEGGW